MFKRSTLLSLLVAVLTTLAAPAALANPPPLDDEDEKEADDQEKGGGNAIDQAESGVVADEGEPDDYDEVLTFWAFFLGIEDSEDSEFDTLEEEVDYVLRQWGKIWRGESFLKVGGIPGPSGPAPTTVPKLELLTDAPAESVLDQIDESQAQLPMVGEPGSEAGTPGGASTTAPSTGEAATPPPESILDFIDQPGPQATGAPPDATKPAVNQAAPPPVVQVKG